MNGTWRYFDWEEQAFEEENSLLAEIASSGDETATERSWITGVPIESVVSVVDLTRRH